MFPLVLLAGGIFSSEGTAIESSAKASAKIPISTSAASETHMDINTTMDTADIEAVDVTNQTQKSYQKDDKNEEGETVDDDLEDGEIETDDEGEPVITPVLPSGDKKQQKQEAGSKQPPVDVPVIDLSEKPAKSYASGKSSLRKFSRSGEEDDWAKNIENAIAAALKKDGIEPSRPEFKRRDECAEEPPPKTKSRKRKKRDLEKEKCKKKKHSHEGPLFESDIDENEMLCIRGASPPPMAQMLMPDDQPLLSGAYYDSDGSYSTYESDDSVEYRKPYEEKRQNRRNKDRRQRKSGGRGGGSNEKRRNRDDSDGVCIDYLRGGVHNVI